MTTWYDIQDLAYSTLAAPIDDTDLSLQVAAGEGERFPDGASGEHILTLFDPSASADPGVGEIVIATVRAGDIITLTQRGAAGTSQQAWAAGTAVVGAWSTLHAKRLQDAITALESGGTDAQKTAGAALGGHRLVVLDSVGEAYLAEPVEADAVRVYGLTLGAAAQGNSVNIRRQGEVEEPSWTWTPGGSLYLAAGGALTQVAPTTGVDLVVGYAVTATKIVIDIQSPFLL